MNEIVLRPYQQRLVRYLDGGGLRSVNVWHRRAGKDVSALVALYRMASQRTGTYFYFLPVVAQAKRVIWHAKFGGQRLLDMVIPPGAVESKNENDLRIHLKNGSVIWMLGSDNVDRVVGTGAVGCVFSEFALAKPQGWDLIRPILTYSKGWAVFISTPRSKNHLHRLYEVSKNEPSWQGTLLSIHDTGVLPAAILEEERRSGMPPALIRQEYECSFDAAQVGSVYGDLLEALANRGGIATFDLPKEDIITSWDLGMSDSTAIWWWHVDKETVSLVDYYESNSKPLSHYFEVIKSKPYKYKGHFFPHDARARNYQTGVTSLELARESLGPGVSALPILPLSQGIEAMRWLLQQDVRVHAEKCAAGLEALKAYAYAFDEDRRTFSDRPEHSWASHGADAARYLATAVRPMIKRLRPTPAQEKKDVPVGCYPVPLEDLFEDHARHKRRHRRI